MKIQIFKVKKRKNLIEVLIYKNYLNEKKLVSYFVIKIISNFYLLNYFLIFL